MSIRCESCGLYTAIPSDSWAVKCPTDSCKSKLLLPPPPKGKKYIVFGKNRCNKASVDEVIVKNPEDDCWYLIDDVVVTQPSLQNVYGTVLVEGIVKDRLAELQEAREDVKDMKEQLAAKDEAIEAVKEELEEAKEELEEAKGELEEAKGELEEAKGELEEAKKNPKLGRSAMKMGLFREEKEMPGKMKLDDNCLGEEEEA